MSGHNKWSKIKHKKAATDAAKSKVFGKFSRLIAVESKKAGGNVDSPGLRSAIDQAKAVSMPSDNIDRAVKKGAGGDTANMEEVVYEAYGPGGSAVIITGLTDNKNRTSAEVKHTLSKSGAELAAQGAASWAFTRDGAEWKPNATVPLSDEDGEKLGNIIEALEENDDVQNVYTNAD
ncbi:YebC/PmpR family DNA-binding transcriptional regulator [Patescibacteria group bacterium]